MSGASLAVCLALLGLAPAEPVARLKLDGGAQAVFACRRTRQVVSVSYERRGDEDRQRVSWYDLSGRRRRTVLLAQEERAVGLDARDAVVVLREPTLGPLGKGKRTGMADVQAGLVRYVSAAPGGVLVVASDDRASLLTSGGYWEDLPAIGLWDGAAVDPTGQWVAILRQGEPEALLMVDVSHPAVSEARPVRVGPGRRAWAGALNPAVFVDDHTLVAYLTGDALTDADRRTLPEMPRRVDAGLPGSEVEAHEWVLARIDIRSGQASLLARRTLSMQRGFYHGPVHGENDLAISADAREVYVLEPGYGFAYRVPLGPPAAGTPPDRPSHKAAARAYRARGTPAGAGLRFANRGLTPSAGDAQRPTAASGRPCQ